MAGYVVAEGEVTESTEGDSTRVRRTIGQAQGCQRLEQRIIRYGPGRSPVQQLGELQVVLYVVSGTGRLHVEDRVETLEPVTGAYVAARETFVVENTGQDDLVLVLVTAPVEHSTAPDDDRTVRWDDRPSLPASPNREFRLLVKEYVGCDDLTQFVGLIPPGRAPLHSHTYDEVVYVIEGDGLLHLDGEHTPITAGTCMHLPPRVEHCLENTGSEPMRVLGVFHPAGSPASRAYEGSE